MVYLHCLLLFPRSTCAVKWYSSAIPWSTGAVNCYFHGLPAQSTGMDYLLCCQPLFPWHTICAVNSYYLMFYLCCQQLFQWFPYGVYCVGNHCFNGLSVLSTNHLNGLLLFPCSTFAVNYYSYGLPVHFIVIFIVYLPCQPLFAQSVCAVSCYIHGLLVLSTTISMAYWCCQLLFSWSNCTIFCYFHGQPVLSTTICMVYLCCQLLFPCTVPHST